jgi:formate dehydrogenase iron-sulfur subunit
MNGASAYRDLGAGDSAGTKLISLNSLFRRPGLVEVPFGIPLRRIVEEIGGGLKRGRLLGVMIGGPLAGLLPPTALDTPFTYEALATIGGAVGHGGVIAFTDDTTIPELIAEVFRFGASESCGLCVPCHRGSAELVEAFHHLAQGRAVLGRERWDALVSALEQTSLCGHGSGLAEFARSIERHYPEELAACLR